VAAKHDDSVKGGEFPELTKAVREGDVATAGACGFASAARLLGATIGPTTTIPGAEGANGEISTHHEARS
jgi:hypothetical protein